MGEVKVSSYTKFVYLVIILNPILAIYGSGIPGWSLASVLDLAIALFMLFRIQVPRDFYIMPRWLLLLFLDAAIVYYLSSNSSLIPLSVIQTFLVFWAYFYYVRPSTISVFINIYRKVAVICVGFFFIQFLSDHLMGLNISGILSFLPLDISNGAEWLADHNSSDRLSSFFSEPSHFASFLIPLVCIELCNVKKLNLIVLLALIASILLSTSGTGVIALVIVLAVWAISSSYSQNTKGFNKKFFAGLFFAIAVFFVIYTSVAPKMMERQGEVSVEYEGGSMSGFMRLWRGYYVYAELPLTKKIIGIENDILLQKYEQTSFISDTFRQDTDHYYNGMSMLLTRQGAIGFILFFLLCSEVWKKTSKAGRLIMINFIVYMLMASVYLNSRMALDFVLICCLCRGNIVRISKSLEL